MSVLLLGIDTWKTASEQPLLFAALIAGILSSMAGLVLRWLSYRIEERMEGKP